MHSYNAVIRALSHKVFDDDSGLLQTKQIALMRRPLSLIYWMMGEMTADGITLTPAILCSLITLFTGACRLAKTQDQQVTSALTDEAEEFLEKCAEKSVMGHCQVEVTEGMCRELVRACCAGGLEARALEVIQSMEVRHGIRPTALVYAPLVFHYAVGQHDMQV